MLQQWSTKTLKNTFARLATMVPQKLKNGNLNMLTTSFLWETRLPPQLNHSGRPRPVWWLWWRCPWGQDFLGNLLKLLPGRHKKNCEDPMDPRDSWSIHGGNAWGLCLESKQSFVWTSIVVVDILMLAATKTYYWLLSPAFSSDYFCCKLSIGNSKMSSLASNKLL